LLQTLGDVVLALQQLTHFLLRRLRLLEQPGVVHGDGGANGEFLGECGVFGAEPAPRLVRSHQQQRPERATPRHQRAPPPAERKPSPR
jgi:hypothetical protein